MSNSKTTTVDCHLNGNVISLKQLPSLTSTELSAIVGQQSPGDSLDDSKDYNWCFMFVDIEQLRYATEDGDEPDGGWLQAYKRHLQNDNDAITGGSLEYKGRQEWLKNVWIKDTRVYPLYVVKDGDSYRLLDGYHRLAGAFHHNLKQVAIFLGTPK